MAHSDIQEAGDDLDSAALAIGDLNLDDFDEEVEEGQRADDASEPDEGDEVEDEQQDDEEDEPGEPAIDAPVSLTAEEKAKFAGLPKGAQQYVADLEARRAVQVQTATTKASDAQRQAEVIAARADAMAQARFAEQVKVIGAAYAPQRPDPALANSNPAAFIAQQAQYEAAMAQHVELMQQAESLGTDAGQQMTEVETTARDRELMNVPEVANEATREQFFSKAIEAGKVLGLDMQQIGHATASELKALRQVADWREKSEKYDAATARQMQRVRDGKKARTTKPNAAQPSSGVTRGYRESRERLQKSGDVKDAAAAIARMGL